MALASHRQWPPLSLDRELDFTVNACFFRCFPGENYSLAVVSLVCDLVFFGQFPWHPPLEFHERKETKIIYFGHTLEVLAKYFVKIFLNV